MKKALSFILASAMTLSLAACSDSSPASQTEVEESLNSDPFQQTEEIPADSESNEIIWTDPFSDESESSPFSDTADKNTKEASIEEQVVFDSKGVRITAKSLNYDGFIGPELNLLIENNTNKDILVQSRNTSVNDYVVDMSLSARTASGKKVNTSLIISKDSLEECQIDEISKIDLAFMVCDSHDFSNSMTSDVISIKTSVAGSDDDSDNDEGEIIYNKYGIKAVAKGLSKDNEILFYIENKSSDDIIINARNVSVNDFMISPSFIVHLRSGKKALDEMHFLETDLKENGIEKIENAEFTLFITDEHNFKNKLIADPVYLEFEGENISKVIIREPPKKEPPKKEPPKKEPPKKEPIVSSSPEIEEKETKPSVPKDNDKKEHSDLPSSAKFTNKFGTPTTKCAHPGCNNYIASSGDTNCCTLHSNRCLECGKYIDEDAIYCMDCIDASMKGSTSGGSSKGSFTNKFGTPTTKCAHPGCSNYIASSGDTNCCTLHSNRCLECGKYIDEDAIYCMDCIDKALS